MSYTSCPKCESPEKIWIALGDIHGQMDKFNKIPNIFSACGIIISGDLTNNGHARDAAKIMSIAQKPGLPVLAQIGNMDYGDINEWLEGEDRNLHRRTREIAPGVAVFGIGGSTPTPFSTPSEFTEAEYRLWLKEEWQNVKNYPVKILVSHNPPKDTVCDDIGGGVHVGSEAVRNFIQERQPDVCICGHIHEGKGTDRIGKTIIINPGTLDAGGYALILLKDGAVSVQPEQILD